jgi:hypothetical protein
MGSQTVDIVEGLDANAYVPAKDGGALMTENLNVDRESLTTRADGNPITPQPTPELVKCAGEERDVWSTSI